MSLGRSAQRAEEPLGGSLEGAPEGSRAGEAGSRGPEGGAEQEEPAAASAEPVEGRAGVAESDGEKTPRPWAGAGLQ